MHGAVQTLPARWKKGMFSLSISYGLLQNCRVFSLFFFYFGGNNQRWWIWNNHFPVIFHLHSFFFPLTCSCDSMHRDPVGFWHIYLVRLLYFLMETLMQLRAEFSSTYKPRMKATCPSDFPAEWSQNVEILFTKHRIYYFVNKLALINWRKRVKNEVENVSFVFGEEVKAASFFIITICSLRGKIRSAFAVQTPVSRG